jgi:hypothetical protein
MVDAPLAVGFSAGMLATFNPCGFAMLPAYLSFFVGTEGNPSGRAPGGVVSALRASGAVTAGFVAVFGAAGVAITGMSLSVQRYAPWATLVIGLALVPLGIAVSLGRSPKVSLPRFQRGGSSRGLGSMALFGVSYATVSLDMITIGIGRRHGPELPFGPADPDGQCDELGVFDQHPPPQRLAEVNPEAAAVVQGQTPGEGLRPEHRPGQRHRHGQDGATPFAPQQRHPGHRLQRDEGDGGDGRQGTGEHPVGVEDAGEAAQVAHLAGGHGEQQAAEDATGQGPPPAGGRDGGAFSGG